MKRMLMLCAISAVFSGCGGGRAADPIPPTPASTPVTSSQPNGAPATATSPPAIAPAPASAPQPAVAPKSEMSKYIGTWLGDCQGNSQETLISTLAPDGALVTSSGSTYFTGVDCSGAVVGTVALSENFITTYRDTVDATVSLSHSGASPAVNIKLDRYTETIAAHSLIRTGPWVTLKGSDGTYMSCIKFNDNSSVCETRETNQPGYTFDGGAYVSGNDMYLMEGKGGSLEFDAHYTRKQ